jgi:uncharacterized RDD family membrane protein YckC
LPRRRRRREPKGQVAAGAGFWIRLLARAIDLLCHYAFMYVGYFCGGILIGILMAMGLTGQPDYSQLAQTSFLRMAFALVAYNGYYVIAEGFGGTTIGKLVCGLRVIGQEKGPCRLGPAILRCIAFWGDGMLVGVVGYISMGSSRLRQRLGDKWGKTMVVKAKEAPKEAKRSGAGVALVIIGAIAFSTVVSVVSLLVQVLCQ